MANRRKMEAILKRLKKSYPEIDAMAAKDRARKTDEAQESADILEDVAANIEAAASALRDLLGSGASRP